MMLLNVSDLRAAPGRVWKETCGASGRAWLPLVCAAPGRVWFPEVFDAPGHVWFKEICGAPGQGHT